MLYLIYLVAYLKADVKWINKLNEYRRSQYFVEMKSQQLFLVVCILDKLLVFHRKLMGEQHARQAACQGLSSKPKKIFFYFS